MLSALEKFHFYKHIAFQKTDMKYKTGVPNPLFSLVYIRHHKTYEKTPDLFHIKIQH